MPETRRDKITEIRDPIHGFIALNPIELAVIDHPAFQRLRRIRQLGWTDMVYPGATHTRFEHSLGVMHIAGRMFEQIRKKKKCVERLKSEGDYEDWSLDRDFKKIRLACLLHDIGHTPFSHAGETLFPSRANGVKYTHEDYSAAIIQYKLRDVIELPSRAGKLPDFTAKEIAEILKPEGAKIGLIWRELIDSQLDADRADYLLRDAYHLGVEYGRYDLNRIISTLTVGLDTETGALRLAVEEGGVHAVEGLVIARFMMFNQVYFHKTRRVYDHHIENCMQELLVENQKDQEEFDPSFFPPPTSEENINRYLKWSDWKVLGLIANGGGGPHGRILRERKHFRLVSQTPETPSQSDLDQFSEIKTALGTLVKFPDKASKSWYSFTRQDEIYFEPEKENNGWLRPLSKISTVLKGLGEIKQERLYASIDDKKAAEVIMEDLQGKRRGGRE